MKCVQVGLAGRVVIMRQPVRRVVGLAGLIMLLLCQKAEAVFVEISNVGSDPLLAVALSFDLAPYPLSGVEDDFELRSHRAGLVPSNVYFPFIFDEANPVPPGASFDTYLIPELADVSSRLFSVSISTYNRGVGGSFRPVDVIPDVTTVDFSFAPGDSLVTRFAFKSGGVPVPSGTIPEPSSLFLLGAGLLGLAGYSKWRLV